MPSESQTESAGDDGSALESTTLGSLAGGSSLDQAESGLSASAAPRGTPSAAADAISEAPSAVWYVRPTTGGQYGPASAEVMRAWVNEGRVGAGSLVWRNGWPEWRAASVVFPQLASYAGADNAAAAGSLPRGEVVQSIAAGQLDGGARGQAGVPQLAQPLRKRRRQHDKRLIASGVLIVVSIVLAIVLFLVSRRESKDEATPAQDASAPAEVSPE